MKVKYLGETSERSLKRRVKNVAGAGKLSHFDGSVFDVINSSGGYEEDLKVIGRITKSGHESIIEHDYIQIGISGVTPIVEQTLIGFRLTAFTIKSRRYVDFRKVGYYIPNFRNVDSSPREDNEVLQKRYKRNMNSLFKLYSEMVDAGVPKEDARFVFPYSFYSDIFMSLDARELKKMIIYLLYSEVSAIQELRDLGNELLILVKEHVPYIVRYIEDYVPKKSPNNYLSSMKKYVSKDITRKLILLDYTVEPDDVIIQSAIMAQTQCTFDETGDIIANFEKKDPAFKEKLMDEIVKNTENRELEQVSFTWQIPISLSILTHLTRHRMHSLLVPSFTPLWNFNNYITPESIQQSEFVLKFHNAIKKNMNLMNEFKNMGVMEEDLVYFYLGCQMCNVITTTNGRELMWITRMRACNRAQWQIREIANSMMHAISQIAPLYRRGLGPTCEVYHYCPEGKFSCGKIKEILEREKTKK